MFSTHNNMCRYFTIAVTIPKPFSMHKHIHYSPYFGRAGGSPGLVLRIRRTVHWNVEPFSVVPLVVVATNQYNACQIHSVQKKWIKFPKFSTHYFHFPWPVNFWAVCLHHLLSWALEGTLDGALDEAL